MIKKNIFVQSAVVFTIIFGLFVSTTYRDWKIDFETGTYRRLMPSGDVIPNTFLPYILLKEHSITYDSIIKTVRLFDANKERPYFLVKENGHFYSAYPILTGIMAVPFYAIPIALNKIPELTYHENILKVLLLGRITASFYAALSVTLMYLTLKQLSKSSYLVALFTLFYALGTNTYSTASRGLWHKKV